MDENRDEWIDAKVNDWVHGIKELAKAAKKYPQTAYAGLTKSLQLEWQYLQRVVPDVSDRFAPLEEALSHHFLPALLSAKVEDVLPLRETLAQPVKYAGLGIPDPQQSAPLCHVASRSCTKELTGSLIAGLPLDVHAYNNSMKQARKEIRDTRSQSHEATFKAGLTGKNKIVKMRRHRARESGNWLTILPNRWTGTELTLDEFRDGLYLRLGWTPPRMPEECDGCHGVFDVDHALTCRHGGLIVRRHNDLKREFGEMCSHALQPSAVSDESLIYTGRNTGNRRVNGVTEVVAEERGDIGVYGFWSRNRTTIMDVRVTHAECPTQRGKPHRTILRSHEKEKKTKYEAKCAERRCDFSPLCFTADGCAGPETEAATKQLAALLAKKWDRTYSDVCGFVKARLSIALVRTASMCIRGERKTYASTRMGPVDGMAMHLHG